MAEKKSKKEEEKYSLISNIVYMEKRCISFLQCASASAC